MPESLVNIVLIRRGFLATVQNIWNLTLWPRPCLKYLKTSILGPSLFRNDGQLAARVGLGELVGLLDVGGQLDEVVGAPLPGAVGVDERHAIGRRLPFHEVHWKRTKRGDVAYLV